MNKILRGFIVVLAGFCALVGVNGMVFADEENQEGETKPATSISISPVNKVLKLEPNKTYDDSFKVMNNGADAIKFEVYASPYSYTKDEDDGTYKLGFSNETTYTQITRWITFRDSNGAYTSKPKFKVEPGTTFVVHYRVKTPSSIPDGGQYAVIFAHTLSDDTESGGLKTEASPGLVVYGRSNGVTKFSFETYDLKINKTMQDGEKTVTKINGTSMVNNSGNVDFMAYGKLTVRGIFGHQYYVTPETKGVSIIPETELEVSDAWDDTPYFGLFNVTWSVTVKDETKEISRLVLILPVPIIILMILLLTIIGIWITIMVRKRKERRSRFGTV